MVLRQAEALARGDFAAATLASSLRRKAEIAGASAPMLAALRSQAPSLGAAARGIDRLIIRGNIATALGRDGVAASFVREDDAWKID